MMIALLLCKEYTRVRENIICGTRTFDEENDWASMIISSCGLGLYGPMDGRSHLCPDS